MSLREFRDVEGAIPYNTALNVINKNWLKMKCLRREMSLREFRDVEGAIPYNAALNVINENGFENEMPSA